MPGTRIGSDGVTPENWDEEQVDPGGWYRNQGWTINGDGTLRKPDSWTVDADGNINPPAAPTSPNTPPTYTNGPSGTTTPKAVPGDRDSLARLRQLFATYGLPPALGDWAWGELQKGVGESEITLALYDRPEFKTRFPAIDARRAKNLPPISPADYIAYEGARRQLLMSAGLPPGFYDDPSDATDDITSDRSINELAQRIQNGYVAVKSSPIEVRDAFTRLFGVDGDAALASFVLDPTRSLTSLQKIVASSTAAGMGWRHNVRIDKATAERLGDRGLSAQGYEQGFRQVRQLGALYDESFGEGENFTAEGVGVDAAFGDVAAQDRLVGRINQRTNRVAGQTTALGAASGERGAYGARQLT